MFINPTYLPSKTIIFTFLSSTGGISRNTCIFIKFFLNINTCGALKSVLARGEVSYFMFQFSFQSLAVFDFVNILANVCKLVDKESWVITTALQHYTATACQCQ